MKSSSSSRSNSNSSNGTVSKGENDESKNLISSNNRKSEKSPSCGKLEQKVSGKMSERGSCVQTRVSSNGGVVMSKITETANTRKTNLVSKRNDTINETLKKNQVTGQTMNYQGSRGVSANYIGQECASKFRYNRFKTCQTNEIKDEASPRYDNKSNGNGVASPAARFASQTQVSHRDNHQISTPSQNPRTSTRENSSLTFCRNVDQRNALKTPNYQSLGGSQRYVDARYSFVNEERNKHSENNSNNVKIKSDVNSIRNGGPKDLTYAGQNFHGYGTSSIPPGMSVQNISNVQPTNITPYVRSDSYASATPVANLLFSDNSQFSQSSTYNHSQVGQLNQYQTYDPSSYSNTPVNSVLTQYSAENTLTYPQYENPPQFVQTNHYPTNEITNSQFQFQTGGVGQIQESPLYLQSLSSPIAEQYAASNYARAVRTELIPRIRAPPKFNK